jgi:hypothetical protein
MTRYLLLFDIYGVAEKFGSISERKVCERQPFTEAQVDEDTLVFLK